MSRFIDWQHFISEGLIDIEHIRRDFARSIPSKGHTLIKYFLYYQNKAYQPLLSKQSLNSVQIHPHGDQANLEAHLLL